MPPCSVSSSSASRCIVPILEYRFRVLYFKWKLFFVLITSYESQVRQHLRLRLRNSESQNHEIYNTLSFYSSSHAQGVPLCNVAPLVMHAVDPLPPTHPIPCSFTPSGPMLRQVPARAYTRASMLHTIGRSMLLYHAFKFRYCPFLLLTPRTAVPCFRTA